MNPHPNEVIASQCLTLLDELKGKKFNAKNYSGYHPKAYGKGLSDAICDKLTSDLCSNLQDINIDVTKYSLELQMWWRDHQQADKERVAEEIQAIKDKTDRKVAIAKLTPHERKLFGFNQGS